MTATFWTVAALLCGVATITLFTPVWRHRKQAGHWSLAGIAASLLIAPIALALYAYVSNWDTQFAERVSHEAALVDQLARHLEANPSDLPGWQLLAASYMQLGRYDEGRAAYERLWQLTPQPTDDLKLSYAEAQILTDRSSLAGEAGRLVEEVLASSPSDPKALWYGGLAALEVGRNEAVRARWTRLLAMNPPAEVARVVETQLAALGGPATNEAGSALPAPQGPEIKLNVALGPGRTLTSLPASAQLFIIARAPEGGPPLAVIRQPPSTVPGEFSLSDANSMIPGRSLASYARLAVVARLSMSGQPLEQAGDWFAEAVVQPGQTETVALVIDQVVQ